MGLLPVLVYFYLLYSLIIHLCLSMRRHASCAVCVRNQLSVFVQRRRYRSVWSGRASMRAGAIFGSAVMLLLLFDAVLLRAL